MQKILFVCLGNICRSPLAEGIFNQLIIKNNLQHLLQCDSAGTGAYHIGQLPDHRSRQVAINSGFELIHKARQFSSSDFNNFDLIIAMDPQNMKDILSLAQNEEHTHKVKLMKDFESIQSDNKIVHDPYYDDIEVFEKVYQVLLDCNQVLLKSNLLK